MPSQPNPAITYEDAFIKYFGTVKEIMAVPLPMTCKACKKQCLSLDSCFEHIKKEHKEKVRTEKQIATVEKRRQEKELEKSKGNKGIENLVSVIMGGSSN
jgi:hypothetical protein